MQNSEIKVTALAAVFFHQMDVFDFHAFVNGLAHVVDGQQSH